LCPLQFAHTHGTENFLAHYIFPCSHILLKLTFKLKERKFNNIMAQEQSHAALVKFKTEGTWHSHCTHCTRSQGNYFERDSIGRGGKVRR
jgi:hypothetical protein